jgi:SAM-dependent methyltransferase
LVKISKCKFCESELGTIFADLGMSPLANSFLTPEAATEMEPFYPLRAMVCQSCKLVQLDHLQPPEGIFSDYLYFSSYSTTWLDHAQQYAEKMTAQLSLDSRSMVIEIASNDGYLLQYFKGLGIPVLGVEPAANVAEVAQNRGIPTVVDFFGHEVARMLAKEAPADLLIANNVLAHVPDLNDFVSGLRSILARNGTLTIEFPHLLRLIREHQWDTIYHEHYSYFSLHTARQVLEAHGLRVYAVEEIPTHGGSLRVFACHDENSAYATSDDVNQVLIEERTDGLDILETYEGFSRQVEADKWELLAFFGDWRRKGKRLVGYGAPAKGNTLLNFCGINKATLGYTCDVSVHKQGRVLPGSHIPIVPPEVLVNDRPDGVLILPWNLRQEISGQLDFVRQRGGSLLARTPELMVLS